MLATTYTADDRERFADPLAAARAHERAEHLRAIRCDRMNVLMGQTIAAGQRLIEDGHYAGADFGPAGYATAMRDFRAAITEAFSGPIGAMLASLEDDR